MTDPGGPSRHGTVPPEQKALVVWLTDLGQAAAALLRLAAAELQLAGSDLRRILVLGALMLPLALLGWLGLVIWLCWLVYAMTGSVGAGVFTFPAVHGLLLWVAQRLIKKYQSSLRLPHTTRHLKELSEVFERE